MRANYFFKRAGLLIGLALYTLAGAEVCVRVMSPQALIPRYVTGTPWGVRGNIPHAVYRHKTQEVNVQYRINGEGMRADRDFPLAKPAGTCRIALFGDSFFVGYELNLEDTFATRLERNLKQEGFRTEVLNLAVSGFGTGEMLRTYEAYGSRFDPDIVVFQWHATDPDDNVRSGLFVLEDDTIVPRPNAQYLPSVALQDGLMKSSLYRLVADNSHLYAWVRERTALFVKDLVLRFSEAELGIKGQASTGPEKQPSGEGDPASRQANRLSGRLLKYAQEEVTAAGSAFVVVDIPSAIDRTHFESTWNQVPPQTVAGIDVVHALDVFLPLASPDTKVYYEKGHGHITPLAAEALAGAVAKHLQGISAFSQCSNVDAAQTVSGLNRRQPHVETR